MFFLIFVRSIEVGSEPINAFLRSSKCCTDRLPDRAYKLVPHPLSRFHWGGSRRWSGHPLDVRLAGAYQ